MRYPFFLKFIVVAIGFAIVLFTLLGTKIIFSSSCKRRYEVGADTIVRVD
jgi:hypothetical protein